MTSGRVITEPVDGLTAKSLDTSALAKLLSALPGMAYECSLEAPWTLHYVSDGVLGLSGYESHAFTSGHYTWGDIVHPEDLDRIAAEVDKGVAERRQFTLTYRIRCPSGVEKWVLERGEALYGPDGRAVSLVGFIGDITEQKMTEQRLRESQSEVLQASRSTAMGTMASTLAHELNQPLTAAINYIRGSEKLLGRGPQFAEQALGGLAQASASVHKAGEIIRRVRKMVATGEATARDEDLAPIIEDSIAVLSEQARETGVSCRVEIAKLFVCVDRVQLQQVIQNLLRNAIEAMENSATKELKVSARTVKGCAEVSVSDTGMGLTAEVRNQLFTPFHSTKERGLGVGLSLCRTIVEAHQGKIWAEDNPGGGTVFHFRVPLAD